MTKKRRSPVTAKRGTPLKTSTSPSSTPSKRDKQNKSVKPGRISQKLFISKECDKMMPSSMNENLDLDEPRIFSGLPAWFSSSVSLNRKNVWVENGGQIAEFDEASFIFSEDRNAADTKSLYKTEKYLSESLSIFHAMYVDDCISAGNMKSVAIGAYMLPSEEVYKSLKEKMSTIDSVETSCCQFKWEAVDCAVCSSSLSISKKIGDDSRARAERSTSSRDLSGYVDINSLQEPDYDAVEEFEVGVNDAEIFLK